MIFWKWWTVVIGGILSLAISEYFFNISSLLLAYDKTYISFFIIMVSLAVIVSISINWNHLKGNVSDFYWYVSDALLSFGMIGTLIGFIIILSQSFTDVDIENADQVAELISVMAQGMGTALLTTLTGLICSLWLKFQLVLLDEMT